MKMYLQPTLLASLIFLLAEFHPAYSQEGCETAIEDSRRLFDNGKIEEAISLLRQMLEKCDYPKKDEEQAMKLLAHFCFEADEIEEGRKTIKAILKKRPYIKPLSSDPENFSKNIDKFKVLPVLSLGATVGFEFPFHKIVESYSVLDSSDYGKSYHPRASFQAGFLLHWHIAKGISIGGEINYLKQTYAREITAYRDIQISYEERFSRLRFPFYARYAFPKSKRGIFPEIYAGMYFSRLLNSFSDIAVSQTIFEPVQQVAETDEVFENNINMKENRNLKNSGPLFGFALNYQFKPVKLFLDVRYTMDLSEFESSDDLVSNEELLLEYYFIDNRTKLRTLEFSFGISYIFVHRVSSKY